MLQVMALLELSRVAVKVAVVCPAMTVALVGLISRLGIAAGLTVMLEVLLIPPAVAVKVTVVLEATLEGEV